MFQQDIVMVQQALARFPVPPMLLRRAMPQHGAEGFTDLAQIVQRDQQGKGVTHGLRQVGFI